jgi:hypothetical protein
MLQLCEDTLGCEVQVVERWQGVYGARGAKPFTWLEVEPGLHAALMHTGVGMSVGPAMARGQYRPDAGDDVMTHAQQVVEEVFWFVPALRLR